MLQLPLAWGRLQHARPPFYTPTANLPWIYTESNTSEFCSQGVNLYILNQNENFTLLFLGIIFFVVNCLRFQV